MCRLTRWAAVTASAAILLLGPGVGVASAAGPAAAGARTLSGGTWGTAIEVPGTATLNTGGYARIDSVSCRSAGNCSAGGFYRDSTSRFQAFVVSQVNGKWGTAREVPGTATLNTGGDAQINSVSCGSAGNCSAGGNYTDSSGHQQVFVDSER